MYKKISNIVENLASNSVSEERKELLQPFVDYIQKRVDAKQSINLNFICTHNSRRSHLSQIWAQTMAFYYDIKHVTTYSGGTEATAVFFKVIDTLKVQGFEIQKLSEGNNPVLAIKYDENELPIVGFSKTFDNSFNPKSNFAAIMTCSSADEGCPFIAGAERRFPIRYNDPKEYDGTALMDEKYLESSEVIASEMAYVFSKIKNGK
ncbi:protein-tyrosine-phosphatase [Flavobacterium jejuense]|uniref:Protein-tyrosine-phosphatase n=1 Tax=Flavobacterium jejuense TaxID=1544455 RepID=A0ABX0IXL4_9FLAO|nr:protein-tyrosine-phosphatase [Flavobacterium jejuense]NHN27901.1 protein-tyrosine-phosphatase [Flavobacterium jejuense]